MKDPGAIAQGRALSRLAKENRDHYRRIYATAPDHIPASRRRGWAVTQLSHQYPERYRAIYLEEKKFAEERSSSSSVSPDLIGRASEPGPDHAVLANGLVTLCGRVRFHTYPRIDAIAKVTCTKCVDELAEKRGRTRTPDPLFREHVTTADARIRELLGLRDQIATVEAAVLEALAALRTPPGGTAERELFGRLLSDWRTGGLTLDYLGHGMGLSRERIRQIAGEAS